MKNQLTQGLQRLKLSTTDETSNQLIQYLELLHKWNKTYNLTAVRDPVDMVSKHLLDSLAISPYLHGNRIIDVGSGAGLPGIPLACIHRDKQFTLLDSNGKKTRFMQHAARTLALHNITIVQERVEKFQSQEPFDSITCRAFASLEKIKTLTSHLLSSNGKILAMKGEEELTNNDEWKTIQLDVPYLAAQRHVMILGGI